MLIAVIAIGQMVNNPGLPTVRQIERSFVDALGGTTAILRPKSMSIKANYVQYGAKGLSVTFPMRIYSGRLKQLSTINIPTHGEVRAGYDGKVGWRLNPDGSVQIYSGAI